MNVITTSAVVGIGRKKGEEGRIAHLFKSPVTKTGTPGRLNASWRARWSTMAAPNRRCASLTLSRCVLINANSRGCFSAAAERQKSAKVAMRGQQAPGKIEPGSKGAWESQNVSVSRRENAVLCVECQWPLLARAWWDGRL